MTLSRLPLQQDMETQTPPAAELQERLARLFDLREHGNATRAFAQQFIHDCFAAAHGARIRHFMPRLLSLHAGQEMVAAFGLREACDERLFLEAYLERPIEAVLQQRLGQEVRREEIIEVGNLSARYPGAARLLIVALTALLHEAGYRWVVFTGTTVLCNGFQRLGLRPVELGPATLQHLPISERADWGRYYEAKPIVMAGDIAHGYSALLLEHELFQSLRAAISSVDEADRA
jgi:hypothetical protein